MRRRPVLLTLAACGAGLAIVVGIGLSSPSSAPSAGRYHHEQLRVGGDVYQYAVYVPSSRRAGSVVPLVVAIHGCTTTADQMATASGYNLIAEQRRFVVLYPDVDSIDEADGRCWKGIWDPRAEGRGQGDARAIAEMTRAVMARWHVDRTRVYAIGISAGGFETAILGAAYPDMYAAIGIHSGAAYMGGEPGCLAPNELPTDTNALARAALAAMSARARVMPVIVFHGDQDDRIPYRCGQQALLQWLRTDDLILQQERRAALPPTPTGVSHAIVAGGHAYTVLSYADRSGCVIAQLWTIHGMGHYWSGGSADPASARYSDPRGPSAAAASWAFFSRWRLSGPVGPWPRQTESQAVHTRLASTCVRPADWTWSHHSVHLRHGPLSPSRGW
jgi:poly(hydroxyalkanoate) depolymerase family esterase